MMLSAYCDVLKSDFLKDLIKAALQERAIDVNDRFHAGLCHPAGKGHGMTFADAGVKEAIRELITDAFKFIPGTHGGSQDADSFIFAHSVANRVRHDFRVRDFSRFFNGDDFIVGVTFEW